MNRANEMDDELWAPIHQPVPEANEGQRKTWLATADRIFVHYKVFGAIPMPTLISLVCQECHVRPENYPVVSEQVRQVIMAATDQFDIRRGKNGGVFRKASVVGSSAQTAGGLGSSVSIAAVNNHTCPGCGNTACSKDEKSCWKCGGSL